MNNNIRRPLYDGMQLIHALWFDLELIGVAAARQRVLTHWTAGARLHLASGGFLLLLGSPRHGHCAQLDGLPLCEENGILSSAPLAPDERAATPPSSIWLVRGARAQVILLASAPRIDPSVWLDLGAIPLATPLRVPFRGVRPHDMLLPPALPLREVFGSAVPPPSQRREALLQKMETGRRHTGSVLRGVAAGLTVAGLLTGASIGALGFLFGLLGNRGGTGSASTTVTRRPGGPSPLPQRLSAFFAQLAMMTGASKIIGWRQATYLRKMLNLLEQGKTQEALRHAIPLNAGHAIHRPAFGAPRPRTSLEISAPGGVTTGIGLDQRLQQHLRATYRRTFERLDREGRIDEATYVLAELLQCGAEAVDYLERKERLKQAAQLAETLELSVEMVVRLHYLAGDTERAIHLARLGQAFAGAVRLLEKNNNPKAVPLRILWAEDLAQRGALCEAADAIWPLETERGKALAWLLEAERAGGTLSMRALIRKLSLLPSSLADSTSDILKLLDDNGSQAAQRRCHLAQELQVLQSHSTATRRIASELVRPLLVDRMAGQNHFNKKSIDKLLALSDGAVLHADMSGLNLEAVRASPPLAARGEPVAVDLSERGLLPIHDARRLPDGDYLLALGENGVVRIDRYGKQIALFPVPATRLVLAEGGQRALALTQRNAMWRVSRIDLILRKVSDWIIQPLRFWADQYDGLLWSTVIDNRLVVLDTSKDQLAFSWQVADLPGQIFGFREEMNTQTLLLASSDELQQWRYQLPSRRLLQRDSFPHPGEEVWQLLPNSARDVPLALTLENSTLQIRQGSGAAPFNLPLEPSASTPHIGLNEGLLLVEDYVHDDELCFLAVDLSSRKTNARVRLAHALHPRALVHDGHILLFDQAGRLVDISREDGAVHTLTLS